MNREVHVRIWERPEVRALRATRQCVSAELGRKLVGGDGAVLRQPLGDSQLRGNAKDLSAQSTVSHLE